MSDYPVTPRSDSEVREFAKRTRDFSGVKDVNHVDVIACVKRPSIRTIFGIRTLRFEIRSDGDMGPDDGVTTYDKGVITIAVKRPVYHKAYMGDGRARNTLAHELGHAVMHDGAPKSRKMLGNDTHKFIRPFESAEHQAKVFAAAFLINDKFAETLRSADEVSVQFGISSESAKIYFEDLTERRNRQQSAEKILRLAAEVRAATKPPAAKMTYMKELCTACGNATLFPVGHKYMCQTCDNVFDRFQDGDSAEP